MRIVYFIMAAVVLLAAGGSLIWYTCGTVLPATVLASRKPAVQLVHDTIKVVEAVAERRSEIPVARVYFRPGSRSLHRTEHKKLQRIVMAAKAHSAMSLVIDGYTDATGGRGTVNDNLASQRTFSLYSYLLGQGVAKERMFMRSFGAVSDAPADSVRRVDVTLMEVMRE